MVSASSSEISSMPSIGAIDVLPFQREINTNDLFEALLKYQSLLKETHQVYQLIDEKILIYKKEITYYLE